MILLLLLLVAPLAWPQKVVSARSGLLYDVDGTVSLDGRLIRAITPNDYPQMEEGQVLDTRGGRAELLLGPEALLWLDHGTRIRFEDTRLENTLLMLDSGAALIEVRSTQGEHRLQASVNGITAELRKEGVYRLDASLPETGTGGLRVFEGMAVLDPDVTLRDGQWTALSGDAAPEKFDGRQFDEFHYWAAYRSHRLQAETNAGAGRWRPDGRYVVAHSGFGIVFPRNSAAAWVQYLTALRAGTVYYAEGNVVVREPGRELRSSGLPRPLVRGGALRTRRGRAELLLGPGVILRIVENSEIRLVDDSVAGPVVALDRGSAMIEVAKAGRDAGVRVQVGNLETELAKAGLYEFDANTLRVYGGEARTEVGTSQIKTKSEHQLSWAAPDKPVKFEPGEYDELYEWSAARSFAMFRYAGDLMVDWDPRGFGNVARHPQFGSQPYRARRRR